MRPVFVLFLGVMMLAAGFVRAAVAQDAAVGVATYIEVMPQSMAAAVTSLRTEAAASRKDDGCQDVQVLREIGRDNRFVVLESWKDQSAFEAHNKAPHAQQFRDRLGAIETAPPDERILAGFWQSPTPKTPSAHSVWVVTHVDVMPPYKDDASGMLKELGEGQRQGAR
jgi:quinol monooxygenase YgiN